MLERRTFLSGLATLPLAGAAAHAEVLAGSGENLAEASIPATFDPIAFIAEMRGVGVVLTPEPSTRTFTIRGPDGKGVPGDMGIVSARWDRAASADPNWIGRVFRVLMAERHVSDAGDAELIAECARVEDLAWRDHEAWARLARAENRYQALVPPRPTIPKSEMEDHDSPRALRAAIAAIGTSRVDYAPDQIARLQDRIERLEAYQAECAAALKCCRVDAAIAVAERWNGRLITAARDLAFMPAGTPRGLAAKASTWLMLRRLAPREMSFEWGAELAEMVIRETVMLEAGGLPTCGRMSL